MATILIIEDEELIAGVLKEKLGSSEVEVITSNTAEQGIETALEKHPELILLDILLPGKNGLEMLQQLREDTWGKTAKVIVMTNLLNPETSREVKKLGALDYVIKSNNSITKIEAIVMNALNSSPAEVSEQPN